ncbi:MAG: DUF5723 family protein [Prevotellaceae bacterium]|jgi:hypothetical protein|nr:DUF5723 family protein [Prevotellaceae bacterium]
MRTFYTKYAKYSIGVIAVLFAAVSTVSAQVNTLYYMKTVATRHEMNPSFQPLPNSYYSILPISSGMYIGAGNNSLALEDIIYPNRSGGEYKTVLFFNNEGNVADFYSRLKKTTQIYSEVDLRLFAMGIRMRNNSYLTIGLNTKSSANIFIPKDLAKLLIYGTPDTTGMNSFNLDRFGVRASMYSELAVGYSRKIDSRLTVGAKIKLLAGHANMITKIDRFRLNASREKWEFDIKGTVNMSIPNTEYELDEQRRIENMNIKPFDDFQFGNMIGGLGAAVDLGANYKLLDDRLTVSASLLDFGFIGWKSSNASNIPVDGHFEFEGVDIEFKDGKANWDEDYFDNIQDNIDYTTTFESYMSSLAAKVMLGAEYGILNHRLTFGGLSKSTIVNKTVFQEITASVNYLPFNFFNASLSYSLLNGRFGTVGLGLGGRLGPFNMYVAGDYMPVKYAKQYVPYKNKAFNLQMGLLLNFGYSAKKNADDDNDGVQNRNDRCPDTPAGVLTDKYGCPTDTNAKNVE